MFDYIKASMTSMYKDDIDMIEEELKENNIKYYRESKGINDLKFTSYIIHAKINTPKELQLLVEKVAAGGIDMTFEFKTEVKK